MAETADVPTGASPARPWLIYVDGDLFGDFATEAARDAALPEAVAAGSEVTVDGPVPVFAGIARREARTLAHMRLRAHLLKVRELASGGNIPAALMVLSDVQSDLDDIQRLEPEERD